MLMLRCKELMHWILSQEVWARDLAGTVCCVLEQDNTLARLASHPGGGGEGSFITSCYRNRDKLLLCRPLASCTEFTYVQFPIGV